MDFAAKREHTPFWRYCRNLEIPKELAHRILLFKEVSKSYQVEGELFRLDSWTQVMLGQGLLPEQYDPIVETMNEHDLRRLLTGLSSKVMNALEQMPVHEEFVRAYFKEP